MTSLAKRGARGSIRFLLIEHLVSTPALSQPEIVIVKNSRQIFQEGKPCLSANGYLDRSDRLFLV